MPAVVIAVPALLGLVAGFVAARRRRPLPTVLAVPIVVVSDGLVFAGAAGRA